MTGVSIDAVEVEAGQYLGAATIGETSILVAGDVDDQPRPVNVQYLLRKIAERAEERHVEPQEQASVTRLAADGGREQTAGHTLDGRGSIPPGHEPTADEMEADHE